MIRYTLLTLFMVGLVTYSFKDWFRSLCALVVLVGVLERPDMPASMFGIAGLNPFSIGLMGVFLGWLVSGEPQRFSWDAPRWFTTLFLAFIGVILIGFLRLFANPSNLATGGGLYGFPYSSFGLIAEFLLNTLKWFVPGVLLFLGCRSKERMQWASFALLGLCLVLALQTIRVMPLQFLLDGEALERRAVRVLDRDVGYHRVELAGLLAGASWAMLTVMPQFTSRIIRFGLAGAAGATALGLALTGGRAGYATWCLLGFGLAGLRWKRGLLLGPALAMILLALAPGISQRFLQGISYDRKGQAITSGQTDFYTVTAGRIVVWPYVLRSIARQPLFGYGREAINRIGLRDQVFAETREDFGHPHNGYLQFALDNGVVGLLIALALFVALLKTSLRLFLDPTPESVAVGGIGLTFVGSLLMAAVGAQSFYPTELSTALWCAVGIVVRGSMMSSAVAVHQTDLHLPLHAEAAPTRAAWASRRLIHGALAQNGRHSGDHRPPGSTPAPADAKWQSRSRHLRTQPGRMPAEKRS